MNLPISYFNFKHFSASLNLEEQIKIIFQKLFWKHYFQDILKY
jgi:hypothetical protein